MYWIVIDNHSYNCRILQVRITPILLSILLALPILGIFAALLMPSEQSGGVLAHLASTVMPAYAGTTLVLAIGVALGVASMGIITAWLVSTCDFPGKKIYEWALILPLAMPTYVMAYAYTDFFQYSGPVQSLLRDLLGVQQLPWFPEPRSLWGAICVLSLALYPYVYLLCRTAFLERSPRMLDAARTLGAGPWQAFWQIALPMARPATMAGVALALMEAVADYGAMVYFGVQTMTTGIYRAWLNMGDRTAAVQLSAMLLGVILLLLIMEHASRKQMRFASGSQRFRQIQPWRLRGRLAFWASLSCALPLLFGFVLPVIIMAYLAITSGQALSERYGIWLSNTLILASITASAGVLIAIWLAYSARIARGRLQEWMNRMVSLGYAVPGTVLAVGVLILVGLFDLSWLLSGSVVILIYAYLTRFLSSGLQTVEAGLSKITPNMDASAKSLGAGRIELLQRVHLPLLRRSLLTAGLLIFVDVMKELPATLVLRPFNFDTLAVITYQLAADERLAEAAWPALTIVLAGLIPVIILSRAMSRDR
ncbi:iron ABC transporter permease [Polynucleobacter sp. MWH-Loch1C5]|nr:iron ABC transporter permease [Polynucleobacter sp. MWH-Loch1C5]